MLYWPKNVNEYSVLSKERADRIEDCSTQQIRGQRSNGSRDFEDIWQHGSTALWSRNGQFYYVMYGKKAPTVDFWRVLSYLCNLKCWINECKLISWNVRVIRIILDVIFCCITDVGLAIIYFVQCLQ